jgi:hydroxypyruvate isomerase
VPRFAANVTLLYPDVPLRDRVAAAARDGFTAVEVQFPYELAAAEMRRALRDARVGLVLLNAPAGAAASGERGLAALPGREADFRRSVEQGLDYARQAGARCMHVMAGVAPVGAPPDECLQAYLRNLAWAGAAAKPYGVTVTIEPINARDIPGYFLCRLQQAADVLAALQNDNVGLQFDAYHVQVMEGDLARNLARHFASIRHVQVAGAPDRNEPDTGEIHYPHLFRLLDDLGYRGWVGCEYRPSRGAAPGGTSAGLGWLRSI